jgi:two-component system phosphate regulon sensor histidine kinase PhoR
MPDQPSQSSRRSGLPGLDSVAPAIIDSLPDALLAMDKNFVVLEANRAARELLGWGLRGRPISNSLKRPGVMEAIEKAMRTGSFVTQDLTMVSPSERFLTLQVIPVARLADHTKLREVGADLIGGAILVFHDVTAQRKSEQMRADFVANASHELRTPLASLVGFIETLQTSAADDPQARERFLEIMARESDRMARLIEDLLSLSRIEMDEHIRPTGSVPLGQVISTVAELLETKASDRGISLDLSIPTDLPDVRGDSDQLTQVFQNVLDNAVKYSHEGTKISVRARPDERLEGSDEASVLIEVQNFGELIPGELLPRLTDRFYRVDGARSREMGSTGLGLAIVKHIVNRHRGTLQFESDPRAGTTVSIGLPYLQMGDEFVDKRP